MLNIENPTLEEAGACAMITACVEAIMGGTQMKPRPFFGMLLLECMPELDGKLAFPIIDKCCELMDDLARVGKTAQAARVKIASGGQS